jgi:CheY-like chemotaxis protein
VEAQPLKIGIDPCSKLALYAAFLRRRGYRLADTPGSECAALVVCAEHALDQSIASWSHVIRGPKFVLAGDPPAGWRRAQRIDTPLLPLHLEQRILAACQANGHKPRPAKTYDVVVVDDDATIRAAAAEVFGALGLNVRGASGFAELTGAFFEGRPDFIVLDLNLPGISGRSLGNIIRGRGIPTALFSSAPSEDVERAREEIGAVKAFPRTTSLATMGQWILRFLVDHVR